MAEASDSTAAALTAALGPGLPVSDPETPEISLVWTVSQVEIALATAANDRRLRALWTKRQGNRGIPLLLATPAGPEATRVLGPQRANDAVREVKLPMLLHAISDMEGKSRRDAAASLAAALERVDREGIPGIVVRGLLTKHLLTRRLPRDHPGEWERLQESAKKVRAGRSWRENFAALGYRPEERKDSGYLLRDADDRPIAVVQPLPDPEAFSRMTAEGSPPEGLLVAQCRREGVAWGLLATDERFRLFPAETPVGAATARYLEIDIVTTEPDDWAYVGLLAPESLAPGGLLERLIDEATTLGAALRETVETQIREQVLPVIARGLGRYDVEKRKLDLASPNTRKEIEDAALLLLFRLLFLLYLESRDFLPRSSTAYRPHSATQLLQDARGQSPDFDQAATTLWSRFVTLVGAMRTGDSAWGLPAYNGDLFAEEVLPGAWLLEEAKPTDAELGPALAALALDPEGTDAEAGVDYGDLEIAHLGRIYEGLLSLHLSLATEPLAYDTRTERWVPSGEPEGEVGAGGLFYQSESGGRKAAGVYYTPQVIVRHLVDRAVLPALEEHLARVAVVAERNVNDAAAMLFDFRVLDPAMGSAHFLADALDRVAERIATFLAERPLKPVSRLLDDLRAEARWDGRIEDGDLFRRLVLKRCIYGVDLNPVAVEVGKISLWLASFVPGLSLAYLGHNLRLGDALVGVADPEVVSDLGPLFALNEEAPIPQALARAREVAARIAETPDRTPEEVEASREAERELQEVTSGLAHVFDVWTSEPFGQKGARDWLAGAADKVLAGEKPKLEERYLVPAIEMAGERSFFHWPVEFPEVFAREGPGFDVVVGNPPWDEINVEELGFYALHDPGLRGITSETERRRRIERLIERFPYLEAELDRRRREVVEKRAFFGSAGGYLRQGAGNLDLYELFTERYAALSRQGGWLGVVLPRTTFLGVGSQGFRRWLFEDTEVRRLDFILNAGRWAFDMEPRYTLGLLSGERRPPMEASVIHLSGPSANQAAFEAASSRPGVAVSLTDLRSWTRVEGRSTYEVPLLPSDQFVDTFGRLRAGPRFDEGYEGLWSAFAIQGDFNETTGKSLFKHKTGVPVWKGRCFDQYDPHGQDPAGFAREAEAMERLQAKRTSSRSAFRGRFSQEVLEDPKTHPFHSARVAFRDVSRATDSRTVRACLIPPEIFLTNSAPYLVLTPGRPIEQAFVLGVMNSLPFDWQARRFVETHLNFYVLDLLCFPPRHATGIEAIASRAARMSCIDGRFAVFAEACGVECGPLEPEERDQLRAEIDALVARAYGLTEADLEVVFSDFTQNAVQEDYRTLVRRALQGL